MKEKIKKIFRTIYQKVDWILMLIGSCMTTYGIFDFKLTSGSRLFNREMAKAYGYYYSSETQAIIAIGVVLLVLGILLHKEKAKK